MRLNNAITGRATWMTTAIAMALTLTQAHCTPVATPPENGNGSINDDTSDNDNASESLNDPLSMPATPTLSLSSFTGAATCGACHPNHYAEWQTSMHAYAIVDPVYRAFVAVRQADFDGERDQFCTQCHTSIGTRGGDIVPGFSFNDLQPITLEGVTCEACHKVSGLARVYNSGHVLDPDGPIRGPIEDPVANPFHESQYSPLHDSSAFCGGCHDVIEQHGLNLERPFEEWTSSPAAEAGRNCQSCHMPSYTGVASILAGVPERDNLHSHRFLGVDMPLVDGFISDPETLEGVRQNIITLLRSAGQITLEAAGAVQAGRQLDLHVTVRNLIDAHNLPTGSTFNRQVWIAVTATDAAGAVLYRTGHLDENGDLRNYFSEADPFGDSDLVTFSSEFVDEFGNPTVFPWKATEHLSSALSPLFAKTFTFFVPTSPDTVGPITIEAQLRFRQFPPFLLRVLGLGELVEKLQIVDIHEATLTVQVE